MYRWYVFILYDSVNIYIYIYIGVCVLFIHIDYRDCVQADLQHAACFGSHNTFADCLEVTCLLGTPELFVRQSSRTRSPLIEQFPGGSVGSESLAAPTVKFE